MERPSGADTADATAPVVLSVTIWPDRELEMELNGCPTWLAQAALARGYELLEPSVLDFEDTEEGDGEEDA